MCRKQTKKATQKQTLGALFPVSQNGERLLGFLSLYGHRMLGVWGRELVFLETHRF